MFYYSGSQRSLIISWNWSSLRMLEYVFTQPLYHEQDVTVGQFSSGVELVRILGFLSLRLVTLARLKNPVCLTIYSYLGNRQDVTQGQFFPSGVNSEFSSLSGCLIKAKEPRLFYYLAIAGGKRKGFLPFLRALAQSEMQTVPSRLWTQVANSL